MVTELPYKIDVDSQSKLTLSQLYWKLSVFNSSTFYKKKSTSLSLWTVGSKLHVNPREGSSGPPQGGTRLSHCAWSLTIPRRYSDSSTSSLDQHIWIENKKEIHNLYLTKYS